MDRITTRWKARKQTAAKRAIKTAGFVLLYFALAAAAFTAALLIIGIR